MRAPLAAAPRRRSAAGALVVLPAPLAALPLSARPEPWIPVEVSLRIDAAARRRLQQQLPPGVSAAPMALERTVWACICRRVHAEAAELRRLGCMDKACLWEERLRLCSQARDRAIRARRQLYFHARVQLQVELQESITQWNSGERLMDMLGVTRWRDRDGEVEIID